MPEFCPGISTWEGCAACPKERTQHPCHAAKVSYWQDESPLQLAKNAIPSRFRADGGRKRVEDGEVPPAPAGPSEGSKSLDHAIVTDERGLPFLHGSQLEPMTRAQVRNEGRRFDEKRKALAQKGSDPK